MTRRTEHPSPPGRDQRGGGDDAAPATTQDGEVMTALEQAAAAFVETWAELLPVLPDDYACHMTCAEAEAAADLFRVYGHPHTAAAIITAHAEHDTPEDLHHIEARP